MDLMPLVADGVACDDSINAVLAHIETCEECRALYNEGMSPASDTDRSFARLKRKVRSFCVLLLAFGIFFGLGLTEGSGIFRNIILMPVMGALGYFLFGWNSAWGVPVLIFLMRLLLNISPIIAGTERMEFSGLAAWSAIYAAFALAGVITAGLLHFAFRKEDD